VFCLSLALTALGETQESDGDAGGWFLIDEPFRGRG